MEVPKMNIYIQIEIVARELDSKLLLAIKAALRGHQVLLSSERLILKSNLVPGIFHTRGLEPSIYRMDRHKFLKDRGNLLTSIDEEGGLINFDYEGFAKIRYSERSIEQSNAVFCWGPNDYSTLKKIYPNHADKFYCTGSPRVDLWENDFTTYLDVQEKMFPNPYILLSSNFSTINSYKSFWNTWDGLRRSGYFDRDPNLERNFFTNVGKQSLLFYEFLKAVEYIAEKLPSLNIVVRPHPVENPESWKTLLPEKENIHVIREGSITPWLRNAIAVIHNGCTTAIEATISGIPVITYVPIGKNIENEVSNQLGLKVSNKEELLEAILKVEANGDNISDMRLKMESDADIVGFKIRYRDHEMASDRIVRIWEEIGSELPNTKNNWTRIQVKERRMDILSSINRKVNNIFSNETEVEYKFPPLDMRQVQIKVEGLCQGLGIQNRIKLRKISQKGILVTAK